jgi:hypothetical protein
LCREAVPLPGRWMLTARKSAVVGLADKPPTHSTLAEMNLNTR